MTVEQDNKDGLKTPAQFIKGVGPNRAEMLEKLGLRTARDILFFFPRDYKQTATVTNINQLEEGQHVSVVGTVEEVDLRNTGTGRSMLGVLVKQGTMFVRAVWFNQPFLRDKFQVGERVVLTGRPKLRSFRWEMTHPDFEVIETEEIAESSSLLPVYRLTEGISQNQMRRVVSGVVEQYAQLVDEVFPNEYLTNHPIWPIHKALEKIHAPDDEQSLQAARHRFVYQEFLVLQLALAMRRQSLLESGASAELPLNSKIAARIDRLLPFELTAGQQQAIKEIADDMARPLPMNRLLQGDVGSGKTVVAAYAMLVAVAHGYQATLMAPTEILANQHFETLQKMLSESRVRMALLTGSLKSSQRKTVLKSIESAEVDIVIGTQAILHSAASFSKLGLAIVDEQHKFGVKQRAALREGNLDPHYLVMTATPIPRTVSMTLFGDLDVSEIRDRPKGRQPVKTYLATEQQREKWWEFVGKKIREGRQAYVVTPLVDSAESETNNSESMVDQELASVEASFERLANGELEEFRLDLVHGRMNPADKELSMQRFRSGETQVLVATSVVEVGVDVPNASIMTIENAERFGLAQLHQLRGRVGRGSHPGFVTVFQGGAAEETTDRLLAFVDTTDGFDLAEVDFQLRGPGDLLGTRQHGLPPMRMANLQSDTEVLEQARRDARRLLHQIPRLDEERYSLLKKQVMVRYGRVMDLGDVG